MIIGINGKIGAGKDTVGQIIQYLVCLHNGSLRESDKDFNEFRLAPGANALCSGWEIRKFADKLKEICSLLTGIPRADFENQKVKDSVLGEEWRQENPVFSGDFGQTPSVELPLAVKYKSPTVRWLLQTVGTEAMRNNVHENVWINSLFADYKEKYIGDYGQGYHMYAHPNWIISDMRFENELLAVKQRGGITISVKRPGTDTGSTHPSETGLDNATFDHEIENSSTIEDLIFMVKQILLKENIIKE